ncbi:tripartite tricarboxylate transporter permease [Paenibacillus sp. GCM10027626]|uniref:tripartite tricarboxylate transporter permease n=1 Tax=Paenibacillus sp. GCM10027626 TaxID=3273411 RepID=UPI00362778EB
MSSFHLLLEGFQSLLDPYVIITMIAAVAIGIIVGALPGLTATMGVALLLPVTFGMPPSIGLLLLLGVYFGGIYGGSITAILLKTPGTPAAAAIAQDGYELTKKGLGSKAISIATMSSFFGGMLSIVALVLLAPQLAEIGLKFSLAETFALAVFGLTIIASISGENMIKGLISGVAGLLVASIGMDPVAGTPRFTFGQVELLNGFALIPVMIGLFAASEAFHLIEQWVKSERISVKQTRQFPKFKELARFLPTWIRSSFIGVFLGIVPGAGGDIAAFVSYNEAKRWSKNKEEFGKGSLKGIAASESAANGSTGGALVPMLTLGIPGDAITAVMLGAFMIQGLQPGPLLFQNNGPLVYTLFAGMFVCYFLLLILGLSSVRFFAYVAQIPKAVLIPIILVLCVIGSYAINNSFFDVIVMLAAGCIGYGMQKYGFPASPVLLALILGPMAESAFRRALIMNQGSYDIFFTRPISLTFLILAFLALAAPIARTVIRSRK